MPPPIESTETHPTPTASGIPRRLGGFASLADALEHAARGATGYSLFDRRGRCTAVLSYRDLRERAERTAARLLALEPERGARVALLAETTTDFLDVFFACQLSGLAAVPLPLSLHAGSRESYVARLRLLLEGSRAVAAIASREMLPFLAEAAAEPAPRFLGTPDELRALPPAGRPPEPTRADEVAYVQYTSGSTRAPRGVVVTQRALSHNLTAIVRALEISDGDRGTSWLPLYHDMGLVGTALAPLAAQISVDLLPTEGFAKSPLAWLALLSERGGTLSFAPPFGYELCARRLRGGEAARFDLSRWRVAGVGAEQIRPASLARFAEAVAPSGFDARAFLPSYGLAECSLAVTFAPLGRGVSVDRIGAEALAEQGAAEPAREGAGARELALCGVPLHGIEVEIRGEDGRALSERRVGRVLVRGQSVAAGYLDDPEATREAFSPDGWLDTGDLGYRLGDALVVTGRKKDLIIVNGKNVWPHDLEALAEEELGLRVGDAVAFAAAAEDGADEAVLLVQCRETDPGARAALVRRLEGAVRRAQGIPCRVVLVPPGVVPRTSSGKPSRASARRRYEALRSGAAGPGTGAAGG